MPKTYITNQGDTWDSICYAIYGTEFAINALIAANIEQRKNVVFPAGIVLVLPEIQVTTLQDMENLPPWKRDTGGNL